MSILMSIFGRFGVDLGSLLGSSWVPLALRPSWGHVGVKIYIDFDVDFWSFWDRSWVPLGGHFRSCWRLFRPKLVPEPSSNRLIFEKVIFHENL